MNNDFVDYRVNNNVEVFVDMSNHNSCWCINYYTEYQKGVPHKKNELFAFKDKNELEMFLKDYYSGYKIGYSKNSNVVIHYVKYDMVKCFVDEKKNELNNVVLEYQEYSNDKYISKKFRFPKEYEDFVLNIIKDEDKVKKYNLQKENYHYQINNIKKNANMVILTLGSFFGIIGDKIKRVSRNHVKNIKRVMSVAGIIALLSGGYLLCKKNDNKSVLTIKFPTKNETDLYVKRNVNRASNIIDRIMNKDYENISYEDLDYIINFIEITEKANYDKNMSINLYNYNDYFNTFLSQRDLYDSLNTYNMQIILNKIGDLYRNCFMEKNNKVVIDKDRAKKFINYVASLTFAYNVYTGPDKSVVEKTIDNRFATRYDIETYNEMPSLLKIIILNQLKAMIDETNFKFDDGAKYYFGSNNEKALIDEIDNLLSKTTSDLFNECNYKYQKNSHK